MSPLDHKLALVAGGGSGGHVFPGLAVAEALGRRGWDVAWVGSETGMEKALVDRAGLAFHPVSARPFLGRGVVDRVRAGVRLLASAAGFRTLVRRLGAVVLLGTGGYISAPAVLGARSAGCPVLLFEPNAEAGLANRVLSRIAVECAVAHVSTGDRLHCPVRVTGVPVRSELFEIAPSAVEAPHGVLIVGGSQGARQLNRTVPPALANLATRAELRITHQTGSADEGSVRAAYREFGVDAEVVPFLQEMPRAMADHQVLISRAGAITLAEICAAGRPSVLVPLAQAEGHQVGNARALVEAGAARMIPSDELTPELLERTLDHLLGDGGERLRMAEAARRLVRRDAADVLADRLESLAEAA